MIVKAILSFEFKRKKYLYFSRNFLRKLLYNNKLKKDSLSGALIRHEYH